MTADHRLPDAATRAPTILIADDHDLVRDGVKLMVTAMWPGARVLEAADAGALRQQARLLAQPALALVDLNMPGMDKGAGLALLARDCPQLRVVVVSALTSPDVIRRALDLPNVYAFVPKSAGAARMQQAIDAALDGLRLPYQPTMAAAPLPEAGLTPRMEEVRALLRQGLSNKQIARQLGLSEGTVKNYLSEIFRVLQVSNRTQAAQYDPEVA
ncbi:MAG: response regulator transcription factor [Alicycliphilus sp.]|jgi:DNA-binding NarL/FixJ family response regulator|nr:response regulator transcription factor [Alicycliphilus sp.]MCA0441885.1 response regulator transcription factor [Pseudomonadota bacterium]TXJ07406.1 MAG: response regulator transcription factor [Alicycliphilus sp.]HRL99684.1 response regulator transcription factor [Acidovorax sp.]